MASSKPFPFPPPSALYTSYIITCGSKMDLRHFSLSRSISGFYFPTGQTKRQSKVTCGQDAHSRSGGIVFKLM
jgi:hypothetical protein